MRPYLVVVAPVPGRYKPYLAVTYTVICERRPALSKHRETNGKMVGRNAGTTYKNITPPQITLVHNSGTIEPRNMTQTHP